MYKQWLAKQSSGFCGTQKMVSLWDKTRDEKFLDCGCTEGAYHINLCSDKGQTLLFTQMADLLGLWLRKNFAHPEITYCPFAFPKII